MCNLTRQRVHVTSHVACQCVQQTVNESWLTTRNSDKTFQILRTQFKEKIYSKTNIKIKYI